MIDEFDSKICNKYFKHVVSNLSPLFLVFPSPTTTTYTKLMGYFAKLGNSYFKNQAKNNLVDLTRYPIKI